MKTPIVSFVTLVVMQSFDVGTFTLETAPGATRPEEPTAQEQTATEDSSTATLKVNRACPEPSLAVAPFGAEQVRKHQEAWAKHLGQRVEWTTPWE